MRVAFLVLITGCAGVKALKQEYLESSKDTGDLNIYNMVSEPGIAKATSSTELKCPTEMQYYLCLKSCVSSSIMSALY